MNGSVSKLDGAIIFRMRKFNVDSMMVTFFWNHLRLLNSIPLALGRFTLTAGYRIVKMRGTKPICQTCPLGTSRLPTLPTVKVMLPGIKGHQVMNVMMSQTCYKHSGSHLLSHGARLNRSPRVLVTLTPLRRRLVEVNVKLTFIILPPLLLLRIMMNDEDMLGEGQEESEDEDIPVSFCKFNDVFNGFGLASENDLGVQLNQIGIGIKTVIVQSFDPVYLRRLIWQA